MTMNKRRHMLSGKKINDIRYDYGKKNTVYVEASPEEEIKLPKKGDILFYKKRGLKEKRLNQINQWEFICVETEGKDRGKWKVQGLHRKEGDFCWFDPKMLRNSKEILTDPVKPSNQPMNKNPITYNHEKKLTQVKRTKNNRREVIKRLLKDNLSQKEIAERLSISPASVSQHVKIIRLEDNEVYAFKEDKSSFENPSNNIKEGEVPILNLTESAQYLRIGKTRLWDILRDNGIKPIVNGKKKQLTEGQIDKISKIIEAQGLEKQFTPKESMKEEEPIEELSTYGIDFPVPTNVIDDEEKTKWVGLPKEKKPRLPVHVAAKKLGISETAVKDYIDSLSIKTEPLVNPYVPSNEWWQSLSDEDIRRIKQAVEIENTSVQREHKATIEMKNYNYKRVISENLRLIKSLVHQTNELLEKIQ